MDMECPVDAMKKMHTMFIKRDMFNNIKSNRKTVEARIATTKYKVINGGDKIKFVCGRDSLVRIVVAKRFYNKFETMIQSEGIGKCMPDVRHTTEAVQIYRSFKNYSILESSHGVLAFQLTDEMDYPQLTQEVRFFILKFNSVSSEKTFHCNNS